MFAREKVVSFVGVGTAASLSALTIPRVPDTRVAHSCRVDLLCGQFAKVIAVHLSGHDNRFLQFVLLQYAA